MSDQNTAMPSSRNALASIYKKVSECVAEARGLGDIGPVPPGVLIEVLNCGFYKENVASFEVEMVLGHPVFWLMTGVSQGWSYNEYWRLHFTKTGHLKWCYWDGPFPEEHSSVIIQFWDEDRRSSCEFTVQGDAFQCQNDVQVKWESTYGDEKPVTGGRLHHFNNIPDWTKACIAVHVGSVRHNLRGFDTVWESEGKIQKTGGLDIRSFFGGGAHRAASTILV